MLAAGLLVGATMSRQPVLLGGGSQMVAVLARADGSRKPQRQQLSEQVMIGTTAWLADEAGRHKRPRC